MSDRSGVEIDYCPKCRGVWLDRGELDKIIERSVTQPFTASYEPDSRKRQSETDRGYRPEGRNRKRENWLGDLFG